MSNFTAEQLEAAKAAKSPKELVIMAKEQGHEITLEQAAVFLKQGELADEELANVAGGGCLYEPNYAKCPNCRSEDLKVFFMENGTDFECKTCGHKWQNAN